MRLKSIYPYRITNPSSYLHSSTGKKFAFQVADSLLSVLQLSVPPTRSSLLGVFSSYTYPTTTPYNNTASFQLALIRPVLGRSAQLHCCPFFPFDFHRPDGFSSRLCSTISKRRGILYVYLSRSTIYLCPCCCPCFCSLLTCLPRCMLCPFLPSCLGFLVL